MHTPLDFLRRALQALVGLLLASGAAAQAGAGFYRFPALHGDAVWFTAEGDVWRVGIRGGAAQRITTHPGYEIRPEISPDGRWLAFVGAYEGPSEAYVMPTAGGVPRRLTWDGQGVTVWGWTPAGEVLLSAPSATGQPDRQLYAIHPQTLARRALPAAQASDGAVSSDGKTLYFTRSGLRGDNARGYRGGAMARVWRLDLTSNAEAQPLLDARANTRRPMPYLTPQGARVAFLSDRDGTVNVWSVDAQGGDARQHTRHADWDIRHAGIDGTRVVYAQGADLHLIDLQTDVDTALSVTLGGDFDQQRTRWVKRPQPYLSATALSPNGERVALTVRGRIATQGVGALRRAELPVPADARCRDSWVIEKLLRRAWAFWQPRSPANAPAYPNMQQTFRGHLAVLINEDTYSDGETFAEGVQRLKLGALIGKRTSGAGVWLSDQNRLQDNGLMRAAELAQFSPDGAWLIEGRGVTPDLDVDNPPRATFNGADAQLDAAIAHLQRRLAEQPVPAFVAPPYPPSAAPR